MVTMVLLKVALTWAIPRLTLRRCFFFLLLATAEDPRNHPTRPKRRGGAPAPPRRFGAVRRGETGIVGPRAVGARGAPPGRSAHLLDALLAGDGLARALAGAGVG